MVGTIAYIAFHRESVDGAPGRLLLFNKAVHQVLQDHDRSGAHNFLLGLPVAAGRISPVHIHPGKHSGLPATAGRISPVHIHPA